jgi:hypothetical protein
MAPEIAVPPTYHWYEEPPDVAVSVTLPPEQKVVEPPGEIDGAEGWELTVTVVAVLVAEQPDPFVMVTV